MTIEEAYKLFPASFRIGGNTISVEVKEKGSNFGYCSSIRNTVILNLSVYDETTDEFVYQTEEQLKNTFWHEVFHMFNYFFNTEMDEGIAQSFANFMCEFEETKKDK